MLHRLSTNQSETHTIKFLLKPGLTADLRISKLSKIAMTVMIICIVFLILCLLWLCWMLAARRRTDHTPIQEVDIDGQLGKPQVKTGLNIVY